MNKLLLFFFCTNTSFSFSQCIADAGIDKHRCPNDPTTQFGGLKSALGGVPPYKYEWRIKPIAFAPPSIPFLYASHILNDTTAANPTLIYNNLSDSVKLYLRVTDSLGCQSEDSCQITFSNFGQHTFYHEYWIDYGDSVYLNRTPNIGGGFGNVKYSWSPTNGLSDTTLPFGFWAKPLINTNYTPTIIDSKGCSITAGGPLYFVYVRPVGIKEEVPIEVNLFPNPTSGEVSIVGMQDVDIEEVKLFTVNGQWLISTKNNSKMNLSYLANGIYFIEIESKNGVIRHKIIKQ